MAGHNFLKASNKKSFSKVKRTSNLFDSFVVKWKKKYHTVGTSSK
jgi:hypothetical protein